MRAAAPPIQPSAGTPAMLAPLPNQAVSVRASTAGGMSGGDEVGRGAAGRG